MPLSSEATSHFLHAAEWIYPATQRRLWVARQHYCRCWRNSLACEPSQTSMDRLACHSCKAPQSGQLERAVLRNAGGFNWAATLGRLSSVINRVESHRHCHPKVPPGFERPGLESHSPSSHAAAFLGWQRFGMCWPNHAACQSFWSLAEKGLEPL